MKNRSLPLFSFLFLLPLFLSAQSRLRFDGFGDHVVLNGTDFTAPWTIECRVRRDGITPYSHLITGTDGTSGIRLEQYINTNKIGITKAGVADWSFNYEAPLGQWIHLAVVCNGASMQLYVDGVLTGGTINGTIPCPLGMVGLNTTGAGALKATIDDLRIWSAALSGSTIAAWYQQTPDAGHPDFAALMHLYAFDENGGDIAYDSAGNLHGAILGATYEQVFPKDANPAALLSPAAFVTAFTANEAVNVRIANNGLEAISEDFEVSYSLDGGTPVTQTVPAGSNPVAVNGILDLSFPALNLLGSDIHTFNIVTHLPGDQNPANDTLLVTCSKQQISLGNLTAFDTAAGVFTFSANVSKVRVMFYRDDIFRIWLAPNGIFTEPEGDIVVWQGGPLQNIQWSDAGDHYKLESAECVLRVNKSPLRFALYKKNNLQQVWQEAFPLSFGQYTRQRLFRNGDEQFYGCGMQNGYFAHRGKSIKIQNDFQSWGDGAVSNPAPFFMSTSGYGIFRNTFSTGQYDFLNPVALRHNENGFDAWYFYGPSLKKVLDGYTAITGRPFLIPRWGMEFGDADCYNDTGTTADVIPQIADVYRQQDMPGGWILPNDGYGCGYEKLDSVVNELHLRGFYTGLWNENPIGNAPYEIGQAGIRVLKLDVALVGPGYRSAFHSGLLAFNGIEQNSNARGYVWTVAGWAGTQRFATVWSGDQSGNWENIRFHIPTVIGSGLSGFNYATGDVDGIFGGSAATYARDLQWKCFTPALMTISGWAAVGKQPWAYGTSNANINRQYLKLKNRLKPYLYSFCREAYDTGVPAVRAMVLEFPADTVCWGTTVQYQFMSGSDFLVAPVYKTGIDRDGIYFPAGKWTDYWTGLIYDGPQTLDNYSTPLSRLPVFVRQGAIIPMYPDHLYDAEHPFDPLTVDIYPGGNTAFSMYEDDGITRDYQSGAFGKTQFDVAAPNPAQQVQISTGAIEGNYTGKPGERTYIYTVHSQLKPTVVELNGVGMTEYPDKITWENAAAGWYYDPVDRLGVAYVKTGPLSTGFPHNVVLSAFVSGTDEPQLARLITLSPMPAREYFVIGGLEFFPLETVEMFDTAGRCVLVMNNPVTEDFQLKVTTERFLPGVYSLKLSGANGVVGKKVVIK